VYYHVVEHDGGWTYKVGDVFAETYRTREAAEAAARAAAERQGLAADPAEIEYQDAAGRWRSEHSEGDAPPDVEVG
jgi:hypothetical protein